MKTIKHFVFFVLIITFTGNLHAQTELPDTLKSKYHMLTREELEMCKNNFSRTQKTITPTAPPQGQVRNIAEWERNQGVIVAYPDSYGFGIPVSLIKELANVTHVYIIYTNSSDLSDIEYELLTGGVNTDNVSYHNLPEDTYWTRDFSPWFIQYGETPKVGIVNFEYNRPRPDDNNIPVEFGNLLNLNVFGMDVVQTGGNYMCDGMHKAASTELVYTENDISNEEVHQKMEDYLGITDYIIATDPMDDYIFHIDCWAKFLDVDKVLVAKVAQSDPRYDDYEAAADYFANQTSSYGNPYQVYRVYAPDGQPYTNSLIMNGHVFIPVPSSSFFNDASEWNDDAVATYQAAMPGYQIHAVENTSAPSWQSTDALHCRTHEIPDIEMLYINHTALYGTHNLQDNYTITADIISYGENALISDSLNVYYRVNNGNWQAVNMTNTTGNTYTANIPAQASGSEIEYIIRAGDVSGRNESHPFIGFSDPHKFSISNVSFVETQESIVSVFPNPTTDKLNIALHYLNTEDATLEVIDINGRICQSLELSNIGNYKLLSINTSELKKGTYIIRIHSSSKVLHQKFIKQ